jgi:hypothetical protein
MNALSDCLCISVRLMCLKLHSCICQHVRVSEGRLNPYLPCFTPEGPLVDIFEHVFATTFVLATILLWAVFVVAL